MSSAHRYILEPYKGMATRHKCPGCLHRTKTFSLYIDMEKNEPLHDRVGRCERVDKCGYHYTPKQYFADNGIMPASTQFSRTLPQQVIIKPSFIDGDILKRSLANYKSNNLIRFLSARFGWQVVQQLISMYLIGSSNHWPGSTVFWQVDIEGKVRTGKIMQYSPVTGKRVKQPYNHIAWAHTSLKLVNFNLKQCLFGEHLLLTNNKPIAIVESEKTALIASIFMPQFNWLACGSLQNLSFDRCKVLRGRSVILYPDLNAFGKWAVKATELGFSISSVLETIASDAERQQGLDIADYLLKVDEAIPGNENTTNIFNHQHYAK